VAVNPWTAVFQSVHSALIDELTERHPEPKPELGMPIREAEYRLPDPALTSILVSEVNLADQRGVLLLASEPGFMKALKVPAVELWDSIMKRAGSEFMRRGIRPVLSPAITLLASSALPTSFPPLGRVVWIPFRIPAGRCHLGLGV
jgi:hypothetical protein